MFSLTRSLTGFLALSVLVITGHLLFRFAPDGAAKGSDGARNREIAEALADVLPGGLDNAAPAGGVGVFFITTWTGSNCPSFELVESLNRCADKGGAVDARIILPEEFSDRDCRNYKVNLGVDIPVERANPALSQSWRQLVVRFGRVAMDHVVLVVTPEGVSALRGQKEIQRALWDACGPSEVLGGGAK